MKISNKEIIKIATKGGILKTVKRTGWILKGVKNAESVADHTWRMGLLILLLAPDNLNKQKLLEMNTIHDLGEVGIGDIKWEEGTKTISSPEDKHADELNTVKKIFGNNKDLKKLLELLKDYNQQKSPEAKFLKQLDKIEMIFQALDYENEGYESSLFDEFWLNAEKYIKDNKLIVLFSELKKKRRSKTK
jgi:putative hydrolases of HD superfamily